MTQDAAEVPTQETGAGPEVTDPQPAEDGGFGGGDRPEGGNKFASLMTEIAKISEPEPGDDVSEDGGDGQDDAEERRSEGQETDPHAAADEGGTAEGSDGADEAEASADKGGKDLPFSVLDADGNPTELQLPEGARIRFKADGRQVEVESLADLVEYASKGVHAHRRLSEMGQDRRRLTDQVQQLEGQISQADKILERILTDDDAYDRAKRAYSDRAAKLEDPEYREGQEAKRRLSAKEREEAERIEREQQQQAAQFWGAVQSEFEQALQEYPYLRADDYDLVASDFHALAERTYEERMVELAEKVDGGKMSEAEAQEEARQAVLQVLTPTSLRSVMRRHNDRIASRVPAAARPAQPQAQAERDPEAEAEQHNRYIDTKRQQKRDSKSIRRGGAALTPIPRTGTDGKRLTFDERMRMISQEIDAARS